MQPRRVKSMNIEVFLQNDKKPKRNWAPITIFALLTLAYVALRFLLIPRFPQVCYGFRHDSAYLAIVARNLLAGRGFVLDALWLNFDNPPSLPMPYRNANPLFPFLVATLSKVTGSPVVWSAFALSALASALLLFASFLLARNFFDQTKAFGMACLIVILPEVWTASWMALTDELWLALILFSVAFLMRSDQLRSCIYSGIFFGLAWLTRSLAIVALPSVIVFLLLRYGWKSGLRKAITFCLISLLVASPWIIRNMRLGNVSSDDNSKVIAVWAYYVSGNDSAIKAFHSPNAPSSLINLISKHPIAVAERAWQGSRPLFIILLKSFSGGSRLGTIIFLLLVGLCITSPGCRGLLRSPGLAAFTLYIVLLFILLSVVGRWTETRYFALLHVLVGLWILTCIFHQHGRRQVLSVVFAVCFYAVVIRVAYLNAVWLRSVDEKQLTYFTAAQIVASRTNSMPVVVGFYPYNYTFVTGAQALAIPNSDDDYLVAFMNKYNACYLFLRADELKFFKPEWQTQLPSNLILASHQQDFYLFMAKRKECGNLKLAAD
jgi:4-amino-4-deoxy-L-arabinose transferase-like glycosyltransferase